MSAQTIPLASDSADSVSNDPRNPSPFDPITQVKPRMFLVALADVGNIVQAAKLAGCSRAAVYHWRNTDPVFDRCFQVAWKLGIEALESAVHERATRSAFPSDPLAMFLLKGGMPERYRERTSMELSGPNGQAIRLDYSRLTDAELATLEMLAAKATKPPAELEPPTVEATSEVVPEPAESTPAPGVSNDNSAT